MAKKMERNASSGGKSDLLGDDHSRSTPKSEIKGKEASLHLHKKIEALTNVMSQMVKEKTYLKKNMKELNKSNSNSSNKFWANKGKSKIQPNQQKGQGSNQANFIQEGPTKSKAQEEDEDDDEQIISLDAGSDDDEDVINYLEDFDEDDLDDSDSINMASTNQPTSI